MAAADGPAAPGAPRIGALIGVLTRLRELGLRADCVAVIAACEQENPATLAALLSVAADTGTAVLLLTTSPACAAGLAGTAATTIACGSVTPRESSRSSPAGGPDRSSAPGPSPSTVRASR